MVNEFRRVWSFRLHAHIPPELVSTHTALLRKRSFKMIRRGTPQVHSLVESGAGLFRDHAANGRCIFPNHGKTAIKPWELVRSRFIVPVQIRNIKPPLLSEVRFNAAEILRYQSLIFWRTFFAPMENMFLRRIGKIPAFKTRDGKNEGIEIVFVENMEQVIEQALVS